MFELMTGFFEGLENWILAAATSAWIYPVLFGLVVVDGVFPPIPSESAVITLGVVAVTPDGPSLTLIVLVAAVGAWCGDQIAYQIGHAIGTERVPFLRKPRGRRMVGWADRALEQRGAAFILAARFVPIGRVAVSMTAGALRFQRGRFMVITVIASVMWAIYLTAIGILTASWLVNNTLAATGLGIVLGIAMGVLLDKVMGRFANRLPGRVTASATEPVRSNDQDPC